MHHDCTSFRAFADRYLPEIESSLDSLTLRRPGEPEALNAAVRYSLLSGGKRLRPILALLGAKACNADPAVALLAGSAVEMVHAFSLIHDDLPCMDDDALRRGKPTNHVVHGEAMALLAGDALLARAIALLTDSESARILAEATERMIEGQVLDMTAESLPSVDIAFLDELNGKKTGALLAAALDLGAVAAGGSPERRESLRRYAQACGLAFQITDDLLDVLGDEKAAGKKVGKDARKGKRTYPAVLGVDESRARVDALVKEACDAVAGFGHAAEELQAFTLSLPDRSA